MNEDNKEELHAPILLHTFSDNISDNSDNHSDTTEEDESLLDVHSTLTNESPESTPNMKDFFLVAWITFLGEMSRGVVVPVLWPYLQVLNGTIEFLGFVSSGFSFARFFAAPFFGWWSNWRGHREVMLFCLVFLIIGNILYAVYPPPWLLLVSRVIIGLGAGTLGQSRGYVSQVTTKAQRTRYMAYLTVSQFAGFAVTPGITSLLSLIDFDMFGVERLEADGYTSAGYLMAVLSLITLPVVFFGFKDPTKQAPIKSSKEEPAESITRGGVINWIKSAFQSIPAMFSHPEITKIILFAVLIFATRTAVAVVETASSQVAWNSFQWDSQVLSYILCAMGVLGTIILILLPAACQRIGQHGEGILLCVGVFSLGVGLALMTPPSKYLFVIGLLFTWALGSAMSQTLIMSFLSRVLHPDSQGAVMGVLASLGSVSRIIGAMWSGAALGSGGAYMALGVPAALMIPCLLGTIAMVIQTVKRANRRQI